MAMNFRNRHSRSIRLALALGAGLIAGSGIAVAAGRYHNVGFPGGKHGSVTGVDIEDGTVLSSDVRDGDLTGEDLHPNTISGVEVRESSLDVPANLSQRVTATDVANASAGMKVPEVDLLSRGNLALTSSCWRQMDTNVLHAELAIRSSVNGAMLQSSGDSKPGGAGAASFLDIDTPITDRTVASPDTAPNTLRLNQGGIADFTAWAQGGNFMRGTMNIVLQNGTVVGVPPPLMSSSQCEFFGFVSAVAL